MEKKHTPIFRQLMALKEKALAKYSNFHVAALLIAENGKQFTGINIESSSYSLTICAERVALFKALSEGARNFKEIHILSDDKRPVSPCGACRQVLFDYAPNITVVMYGSTGEKTQKTLRELFPDGFNDEFLK